MTAEFRVLGLDLALSTGWALMSSPRVVEAHGAIKIRGKGGKRFAGALEAYENLIEDLSPDVVAFEKVNFAAYRMAYGSFCRLSALVMVAAYRHDVEVVSVDTSTLKVHWSGKGRASKKDMCDAVRNSSKVVDASGEPIELYDRTHKWGSLAQEDMADAIAVAHWAYNTGVVSSSA